MKNILIQKKLSVPVTLMLALVVLWLLVACNSTESQADSETTSQTKSATSYSANATPPARPTLEATVTATSAESIIAAAGQPVSPLSPLSVPNMAKPIEFYTYEVLNIYPHDPSAFTQGLIYQNGTLYEGTGLMGRSSLRKVDLKSGTVIEQVNLTPDYFGEGITLFNNRIIQLTWQSGRGFIWGIDNSFTPIKEYRYPTEGWGITHDDSQLIMSDGSDTLYFWDPAIMTNDATEPTVLKTLPVRADGEAVVRLNELEYVKGEIYANIWQTDQVARIDPDTGNVVGWIDLTALLTPQERAATDVLNGIAYDAEQDRLFVTGKLWPKLFEIRLIKLDDGQ